MSFSEHNHYLDLQYPEPEMVVDSEPEEMVYAPRELLEHMQLLCKTRYGVDWLPGLEIILWEALINENQKNFGLVQLNHLRELCWAAGGWWVLIQGHEAKFLSVEDWEYQLETAL